MFCDIISSNIYSLYTFLVIMKCDVILHPYLFSVMKDGAMLCIFASSIYIIQVSIFLLLKKSVVILCYLVCISPLVVKAIKIKDIQQNAHFIIV